MGPRSQCALHPIASHLIHNHLSSLTPGSQNHRYILCARSSQERQQAPVFFEHIYPSVTPPSFHAERGTVTQGYAQVNVLLAQKRAIPQATWRGARVNI